jgi:predicted nucleic acid-binding protein
VTIYLDTCILICIVEGPSAHQARVAAAMQAMPTATFAISDLVRLECRVGPLRRAQQNILALYEQAFAALTVLACVPSAFDRAAELRASHGLKTPDALHAGVAMVHGCDELWTNDQRLASIPPRLVVRIPL